VATELLLWPPEKIATAILLRNGRHAKEFCRASGERGGPNCLAWSQISQAPKARQDDSLGCSEAETQEMQKIDQALKERQMSRAGFHFQS